MTEMEMAERWNRRYEQGVRGSLTGITVGTVTQTEKVWRTMQALGDIAFAYSYSLILVEIQVMHVLGFDPHAFAHFRDKRKRQQRLDYYIQEEVVDRQTSWPIMSKNCKGVKCGIYGANSAEWIMSMHVKQGLGGRVRLILSGAATLSVHVEGYLQALLKLVS
ncbi:hypothetical protein JHK87_049944 [Glycine soja]|nr:hypothetical protein JHK87_049944 [Glycine soja]